MNNSNLRLLCFALASAYVFYYVRQRRKQLEREVKNRYKKVAIIQKQQELEVPVGHVRVLDIEETDDSFEEHLGLIAKAIGDFVSAVQQSNEPLVRDWFAHKLLQLIRNLPKSLGKFIESDSRSIDIRYFESICKQFEINPPSSLTDYVANMIMIPNVPSKRGARFYLLPDATINWCVRATLQADYCREMFSKERMIGDFVAAEKNQLYPRAGPLSLSLSLSLLPPQCATLANASQRPTFKALLQNFTSIS